MPTVFVTGDSTTGLNPPGEITGEKVSWSDVFSDYITPGVVYRNRAAPGRSIRDYHHRGLLASLLAECAPGDIILACHGHLERTPLTRENDRARGSLRGDGNEEVVVYDHVFRRYETIHTFGWYLRRYFEACTAVSVTPIFISPPVRCVWENNAVRRTRSSEYADLMQAVSRETGAIYIDIASVTAQYLNSIGEAAATALYLKDDITHTNAKGAGVYAQLIAQTLALQAPDRVKSLFNAAPYPLELAAS